MKTLLIFLISFSAIAITDYDKVVIGKTNEAELIKLMPSIVMSRQMLSGSYRLCKPFHKAISVVIYGEGSMSFYINNQTGIVCNKRK